MFRLFFFFFKQKTAYEMRISDWSSDVCSSDLLGTARRDDHRERQHARPADAAEEIGFVFRYGGAIWAWRRVCNWHSPQFPFVSSEVERSEEHTSELQSLMRIQYGVFCLNKKKKNYKMTDVIRLPTYTNR